MGKKGLNNKDKESDVVDKEIDLEVTEVEVPHVIKNDFIEIVKDIVEVKDVQQDPMVNFRLKSGVLSQGLLSKVLLMGYKPEN